MGASLEKLVGGMGQQQSPGVIPGAESYGKQGQYTGTQNNGMLMDLGRPQDDGSYRPDDPGTNWGELLGGQGEGRNNWTEMGMSQGTPQPVKLPDATQSIAGLMSLANGSAGGQQPYQGFNNYQNPYMTGLMKF